MTVDVSKIAASSYIMGLEQLSTTKTNTLAIGGQTLAASGNATYTLSVTAPVAKSFALGRIKFVGLTASNPADIGSVWYPVEGTFSLFVTVGTGGYWLEAYMSRVGTTYTLNFEIANNLTTASVVVPGFTLTLAADFYAYPF